ncbi:MAG: TonB-dependent receptor [Bacteroidales bacterium]|nr:TonB-dependent receptor [Bacteroidales bacterium]
MRTKKIFTLICLLFAYLLLHAADSGIIRGTVIDDATGESLPGVTVYIEEVLTGTMTDLDGAFNLNLDPGKYDLRISFVSYETIIIDDLEVKSGEVILLEELRMKEASIEIEEVVITAGRVRNTETALLTIKQISPNLLDGISAVNFKKIGDPDAASSMKRVPGVSVTGGKYVYVRGLGDRYTKTILNGVDIPGLDPDRNTLQMDIFPSNILDNIIVHKSFSAELPADFTGGVVDIAVKDFPETKTASVSLGVGYNPGFHFNSDYLTYTGGKTDFLGFDDGTRAIPAIANIPFFVEVVGNPDGEQGVRYREILEGFNPEMAAFKQKSFMDYNFGTSFGNQSAFKKFTLGYSFTLSYKNNTEYYENAEYGSYGLPNSGSEYEMDVREFQLGNYGISNVLVSGLAGIAIKTLRSKVRINLLHLQNGESTAGIFSYKGSDQGSVFSGYQHNLEYSQRSLTNLLLNGKHHFMNSGWDIDWKFSPTLSKIEDPDIRFTRYVVDQGTNKINTESGFPERIWRNLEEINLSGILNVSKEFEFRNQKAVFRFGGSYTYKERDFVIRSFALNIRNVPLTGDPNELFDPENLWPMDENPSKGTTYEAPFIPTNPNQFSASTNYIAGYSSIELCPFSNLKAIAGVRVENFVQRYSGEDQLGNNILENDKVLDDLDFFPSVSLVYNLSEKQNLRFSYSRTIARPSFKELSYAEIYDPINGRTFVGGLFRDANDLTGIEYWDGKLVSTYINNFDLRWEFYRTGGQMISVSGFYKRFDNPIEIVQYATQIGAFQPRNVGNGEVTGTEVEIRQNLIGGFNFSANLTYAKSRIKMSKTEYNSRVETARTGQIFDEYRDMAGQSPFIINCGISYSGDFSGLWNAIEAGLYYNVQGQTLQYIGIADRPDIYSKPFHSLNFNSNMSLGKNNRLQTGFKISNILNARNESVFKSFKADDQYFNRLHSGTSFSFSMGYKFF